MSGETFSPPGSDSHQERFVPPTPEARELSRAEEIMQNRDLQLEKATSEQAEKLRGVREYYAERQNAITTDGAEELFQQMNQSVPAWLHHTADTVHVLVEQTASLMQEELTRPDKKLLAKFHKDVAEFGFNHAFRQVDLSQSPSSDSRLAVTALMDFYVDQNSQHQVQSTGVASPWVTEAIDLASSDQLRQALRTSLDSVVIDDVYRQVESFDATSPWVDEAIKAGSTDTVRRAMRESIDINVLYKVREDVSRAGSAGDPESIKFGSSERVRQLIAELVAVAESPKTTAGANESIPALVDRVADMCGGLEWLRAEDQANIQRVVDAVKALRAEPTEPGKPVTDRKVYTTIRSLAQASHVSGPDQSGQIEEDTLEDNDFKILNALMGGKPAGTIPFR